MGLFRNKELQPMRQWRPHASPLKQRKGDSFYGGKERGGRAGPKSSPCCAWRLTWDMRTQPSCFPASFSRRFLLTVVLQVTGWYAIQLSRLQLRGRLLTPSGCEASGTGEVFLEDVLAKLKVEGSVGISQIKEDNGMIQSEAPACVKARTWMKRTQSNAGWLGCTGAVCLFVHKTLCL